MFLNAFENAFEIARVFGSCLKIYNSKHNSPVSYDSTFSLGAISIRVVGRGA